MLKKEVDMEQPVKQKRNAKDIKDSFFTGIGIAVAFIGAALLLFLNPEYFGNQIATTTVLVILLVIGVIGLNKEVEKYTRKRLSFNFADLFGAALFLVPWYLLQFSPHHWLWNIGLIFLFILGLVFATRWLLAIGERILNTLEVSQLSSRVKALTLTVAQLVAMTAAMIAIFKELQGLL